jgi:hypothetical protein
MKTRLIILASTLLLTLSSFSQPTSTAPQGQGTSANPFLIENLSNLLWIAENPSHWGEYYKQTADINASETANMFDGKGWKPIGFDGSNSFTGSYDGNGYLIAGLFINRPGITGIGFFGFTSSATITGMRLTNSTINGNEYTGVLVGYSQSGTISNCSCSGSLTGSNNIGGLVGFRNGDILNCNSNVIITGNYCVGGVVGFYNGGTIKNCYNLGDITCSGQYIGGIVGKNYGNLENCYNKGKIVGSYYVGGLTGLTNGTIGNSFNAGIIHAYAYVGGLTGQQFGTIVNCYNLGDVSGSYSNWAGGISYFNYGNIINCYNAGTFSDHYGYGVVLSNSGNVTNCFWDTEKTGIGSSSGGTGLTTSKMKGYVSFVKSEWDFKGIGASGIWNLSNGRNNGYPYFDWQYPDDPGFTEYTAIVSTQEITNIGSTTATGNGTIINVGKPVATSYGICWNTSGAPSINDNIAAITNAPVVGNYSLDMTGLNLETTYYIRAYATNSIETVYGDQVSFTTDAIAAITPEGSGTSGNPYLIANLGNLLWIAKNPSSWNSGIYFKQTADIDVSQTSTLNGGQGWYPIGNGSNYFYGNYDGNNFTIKNITINQPNNYYTGLFGFTYNANLSNIKLTEASIIGYYYTGGLIGRSYYTAINNCSVAGNINGYYYVGGLVGNNRYSNIQNCHTNTNVNGTGYIGGIMGYFRGATMNSCYSEGTVEGSSDYAGGLVGYSISSGNLNKCYSICQVKGNNYVGGLIGYNNSTIANCYNLGGVKGYQNIGGIIGSNYGTISNCFSNGAVTGTANIGGAFGINNGTINNCLWDIETSGNSYSSGGFGKTNTQMQDYNSFINSGWDYKGSGQTGIWNQGNNRNNGYPYFDWQFPGDPAIGINTPITSTVSVYSITTSAAVGEGNIVNIGNPAATLYGICWNTTGSPTTSNSKSELTGPPSVGSFSLNITGLSASTDYYVRAYATNSNGTRYGNVINFRTPPNGAGTSNNPYLIANLGDLLWISNNSAYWTSYFKQTANIDASETSTWNGGMGWLPIAPDWSKYFSGSYDGDGHSITGLYVNRPINDLSALFGYTVNATLKNIVLSDVNITGANYIGSLAGYAEYGTILNCSSSGTVIGSQNVGGLIGLKYYNSVQDCHTSTNVNASYHVGGLLGVYYDGNVLNCYTTGNIVSSSQYSGGIVGYNTSNIHLCYSNGNISSSSSYTGGIAGTNYSTIDQCYATGIITSSSSYSGGIAGYNNSTIQECFFSGSISSLSDEIGGIVGYNEGNVQNSYNVGNIKGVNYVGGLIGMNYSNWVNNCYNAGIVSGNSNVGGLLGYNYYSIGSNFWNSEISGTNSSIGGIGKTTAEMININTYNDALWYIKGVTTSELWNIGNNRNNGYPYLNWQYPGDPAPTVTINARVNTSTATNVTAVGAELRGEITYVGSPAASSHGFCWNTSGYPTISDKSIDLGSAVSIGSFSYVIENLQSNKTYYFRSYHISNGNTIYGDERSFTTLASCYQPTNLFFNNYTGSSVQFNWDNSASTSWNIEWGPSGFAKGSGSSVSVNSNYYKFENLENGKEYEAYVQTDCGSSNLSTWTNPISFNTSSWGDDCSNAINLNTLSSPFEGSTVNASANFSYCGLGSSGDRIFTYDLEAGATIEIWQSENNFDSRYSMLYGGSCPGSNLIICKDDPDYAPAIWQNTTSQTQRVYFILGGYNSENGTFILNWKHTPPPACAKPISLSASNITISTVTFNWTEAGNATSWNIEYGPSGFVLGTGTRVPDLTSTTINISGLTANTSYQFYVQSSCAYTKSDWVASNTYITLDKATPVIFTLPTTSRSLIYGEALNNVNLNGGVAKVDGVTVAGNFYFVNPSFKPEAGTISVDVKFVPTNTSLYKEVVGQISVVVNKASATVTITSLSKVYNSYAQMPTITTNPANLDVSVTYNGSTTLPISTGAYTVVATVINSNYVGSRTRTFNITTASLTVTALNLFKQQGTALNFTGREFRTSGMFGADTINTVTLTSTGSAAGAALGNYDIIPSNANGAGLTNYAITYTNGTLTVNNTIILTITGIVASDKDYDGTKSATITNNGSLVGVQPGHTVSLNYTGAVIAFTDKNVQTGKTVVITGLALSGVDAANYSLASSTAYTTASIRAKSVTVTPIADQSKVYGDNDPYISFTNSGIVIGDAFVGALSRESGEKPGKYNINKGTLDLGSNYSLTFDATPVSFTIKPRELTIGGTFSVSNRTYDGTTNAAIANNNLLLLGVRNSDAVSLNPVVAFESAGVSNYKAVKLTSATTISGADIGNYTLSLSNSPATNAAITAKVLTVGGSFAASNKPYDGTSNATISTNSLTLTGIINSDNVSLNPSVSFSDNKVGNAKTVALNGNSNLSGTSSGNYALSLTGAPTTSANITAKELTITGTFTAFDKVRDGNTNASIYNNSLKLSGVIGNENVTLNPAVTFADASAGTAKTVSITSTSTLSGNNASNYSLSLSQAPTAKASITPIQYLLTINIAGLGKVKVNGTEYSNETKVSEGSVVSLVATAEVGWIFGNWNGSLSSKNSTENLTVNGNKTVTANFNRATNIDANIADNISIYPNPFGSLLTIENAAILNKVTFVNVIGKKVLEVTTNGLDKKTISTEKLDKGMYMIILQSTNGEKVIKKMLKQ